MKAELGTKQQLLDEITDLRERIQELEASGVKRLEPEKAPRKSERKYRELYDNLREGSAAISLDGTIMEFNTAFQKMLGYPASDLKRLTHAEITPEKWHVLEAGIIEEQVLKRGYSKIYEKEYQRNDGTIFPVEVRIHLIRDKNDEAAGMWVLIWDISKRKRREDELRIVYDALNSAVSGIIIMNEKGRIKYANTSFLGMFGYETKEEVQDKNVAELFAAEKIRRFADLEAIIDEAKGDTEEFVALRRDGSIFHVEASTSRVADSEGHEEGRMASFMDITYRKSIEEALKGSSEKIKHFAYSISHDLKSPATSVYGLTNRLHRDYADILDEKGKRYCDQILNAAEQIATLVEQVNSYIASKETPLAIERLDLKEILQVIREEFAAQLNLRQVEWHEPDELPQIAADRLSLIRVFRNLVDNALKYGRDVLQKIEIGYKESHEFHILSVQDDGIGLTDQDTQDVFGVFIRKKTSKGVDGSGLGLAIVREIAERHGGQAWLEPRRDKGITVYVSISKRMELSD